MTEKSSIRQHINDLIRNVVKQSNLLLTTPLLVDFFDGDHNAALLMNQVLYWTDRTSDPEGWFYKTYDDWYEELRFSEYQVRRVVQGDDRVQNPKRNLWEVGLETVVRMAPNGRNATFFRLDVPQFVGMFVEWLENRFGAFIDRLNPVSKPEPPKQPEPIVAPDDDPADAPAFLRRQQQPDLQPTEQVNLPWQSTYRTDGTVADAWRIAHDQLAVQFDTASFYTYFKHISLVDYAPVTHTFTLSVRQADVIDTLRGRLYDTIQRVLSDVFGQVVALVFVSHDEWRASQRE